MLLPSQVVDTTLLPPADRFDFWYALVSQETAPAHISSAHMGNFIAYARAIDLGAVRLTGLRYPSLDSTRSARLVRRSATEIYQLALPMVGRSVLGQGRRKTEVKPSDFTFLDTARPYVAHHATTGQELAATITVQIPHSALHLSADLVRRLLAVSIPAHEGMGALLADFLRQVAGYPEQYRAADAVRLGNTALDLISATLAQHLELERALPLEVQQQALRARIDAFIDRNLGDRQLTPRAVAAAHSISLRTLHRLFEGEDTTVGEMIRTRRLALTQHVEEA